jgi:hypothetical protein
VSCHHCLADWLELSGDKAARICDSLADQKARTTGFDSTASQPADISVPATLAFLVDGTRGFRVQPFNVLWMLKFSCSISRRVQEGGGKRNSPFQEPFRPLFRMEPRCSLQRFATSLWAFRYNNGNRGLTRRCCEGFGSTGLHQLG